MNDEDPAHDIEERHSGLQVENKDVLAPFLSILATRARVRSDFRNLNRALCRVTLASKSGSAAASADVRKEEREFYYFKAIRSFSGVST